ncbi:phytanoyl-CoA dioxygenase family protein [Haloglomus halophilum]|uniref:phytanoyl-CoA dioxygenase family protein n=1 Tax=Haloglomus halophilum TaxID=2962672 RepID=UPI0020C9F1B7|nr:phytanoyl-CoA dioxygenase family protein [Haloglomus halophilum]
MALETLTDAEFAQYQREGYVVKRGLFDADTVARVRERLREYTHGDRPVEGFDEQVEPEAADEGVDEADAVRKFEGLGLLDDEVVHDLATDDRLVTVAQDLLGPDVKLLRSAAMFKPPHVGSEKGLHQDSAYYPVRPYDQVTTWVALDDATPENGCMEVLPGGHMEGLLEHETQEYETDIVIPEDLGEMEQLPMEAGDVLFQHSLLPHRTSPNTTDRWRRAMIFMYMDARSRFTVPEAERPPWVDSVDVAGDSYPGSV